MGISYLEYLEVLKQKREFCIENDDVNSLLFGRTEENQKRVDEFDKQIYDYIHVNPYRIDVLEDVIYAEKMYLDTLDAAIDFAKSQLVDDVTSVRVVYVPSGKEVYYKIFDYDENRWYENRIDN